MLFIRSTNNAEDDIYQAPNFKIEVTSEKKNADYKINIISSEGFNTLFAKII